MLSYSYWSKVRLIQHLFETKGETALWSDESRFEILFGHIEERDRASRYYRAVQKLQKHLSWAFFIYECYLSLPSHLLSLNYIILRIKLNSPQVRTSPALPEDQAGPSHPSLPSHLWIQGHPYLPERYTKRKEKRRSTPLTDKSSKKGASCAVNCLFVLLYTLAREWNV